MVDTSAPSGGRLTRRAIQRWMLVALMLAPLAFSPKLQGNEIIEVEGVVLAVIDEWTIRVELTDGVQYWLSLTQPLSVLNCAELPCLMEEQWPDGLRFWIDHRFSDDPKVAEETRLWLDFGDGSAAYSMAGAVAVPTLADGLEVQAEPAFDADTDDSGAMGNVPGLSTVPIPEATSVPQPSPEAVFTAAPTSTSVATPTFTAVPTPRPACDPSYPDVCIPPPPPNLNCSGISYRNFRALPPDPHNFDGNNDGVGCEADPTNTPVATATRTPTRTPVPAATATPTRTTGPTLTPAPAGSCHASYPDFCIPPPPPDLDCGDFQQKRFRVVHTVADPDPHRLDGNKDGIACET